MIRSADSLFRKSLHTAVPVLYFPGGGNAGFFAVMLPVAAAATAASVFVAALSAATPRTDIFHFSLVLCKAPLARGLPVHWLQNAAATGCFSVYHFVLGAAPLPVCRIAPSAHCVALA